jgi:hypothetical protein
VELNELRLRYAEMLAAEGDISCAFNATVYGHTLKEVPAIVEWGQKHIDIVNILVFIAYRAAPVHKDYDYYVGGRKVDATPVAYAIEEERRISIMSTDIVDVIRTSYPDFMPSAYLNSTERPDHFKWLLTLRMGTPDTIYGYAGPKFMELGQVLHHLVKGNYLAYTKPSVLKRGRSMLWLGMIDRGLANTASAYLHDIVHNPLTLFKRLHMQSVMIIQPADFMQNGALGMCDGCPDITVHEGKLVWSCRMDELVHFGDWMRAVPKTAE